MVSEFGFDPERDAWSNNAAERLLPPILRTCYGVRDVIWAWSSQDGWMRHLDRTYGVDAMLHSPRRNIALAVRLRSRNAARYGDLTIRYRSLQNIGKMLEVEKSVARLYFYGWCDTDKPSPPTRLLGWQIVDLQRLLDYFLAGQIPTQTMRNHDRSSDFLCFKHKHLQERLLVERASMPTQMAVLA